jgi:hypothetical protein
MIITQKDFNNTVKRFDKEEKRSKFFILARNLMKRNLEIEASLLILATWNTKRFQMVLNKFDVDHFRNEMQTLTKYFRDLKYLSIKSIDLCANHRSITHIFNRLSRIEGVEYTGASKVMHLKNPNLFVMWDGYIRGKKSAEYYKKLKIFKNHQWKHTKYRDNAQGYICFLSDMQCCFGHLQSPTKSKTLAKAIDEFNYVQITLRIQNMEKRAREIKSNQ